MAAIQRIATSGALRSARWAPAVSAIARRGYAEAAAPTSDKLNLSLVLPHEVCTVNSFQSAPQQNETTRLWNERIVSLSEIDLLQVDECYASQHCCRDR